MRSVSSGASPYGRALDVTDADEITAAIDDVVGKLGPVGILVNNAGVSLPAPIDGADFDAAWDLTLAVNLTGYARMVRACLPHLLEAGGGRIVNIASTEGLGATPGISPYTASKHGVVGLTRSLACELGPQGITVNCVCPGPIHTGMTAVDPRRDEGTFARRRVPLRRYGDPEEVAHMVLNLALARVVVRERRGRHRRRWPVCEVRIAPARERRRRILGSSISTRSSRSWSTGGRIACAGPDCGCRFRADAPDLRADRVQPGRRRPRRCGRTKLPNGRSSASSRRTASRSGPRSDVRPTTRGRSPASRSPAFDRAWACAFGQSLRSARRLRADRTDEVHVVRCDDAEIVRTADRRK